MIRYIIRRLLGVFVLMIVISIVTFLVFFAVPASPAVLACGKTCTPVRIAEIKHKLGLDRPMYVQYANYAKGIVAGRWYPEKGQPGAIHCPAPCFGYSFKNEQPVWNTLLDRAPATFSIAIGAAILWLVIGLLVGIVSALRRGSLYDRAAMTVALAGVSFPSFLSGLLLLIFLGLKLQLFPSGGYINLKDNPLQWFQHLILPWITLAFLYAALYARLTRANMLETMNEDYIRTARAKGLSERAVVGKHGLRAALTPIITIFGLDLGALLGGAVITERVFGIQGLGQLTLNAIGNTDLPVILGVTLFAAFFIVFANLVVDVVYAYVDPKVRYS
ncbi:MAG: ABC transporter permease [Actinomycetota bacterium]|nr:ABC transporter permease [Actinomycetota bacterium]